MRRRKVLSSTRHIRTLLFSGLASVLLITLCVQLGKSSHYQTRRSTLRSWEVFKVSFLTRGGVSAPWPRCVLWGLVWGRGNTDAWTESSFRGHTLGVYIGLFVFSAGGDLGLSLPHLPTGHTHFIPLTGLPCEAEFLFKEKGTETLLLRNPITVKCLFFIGLALSVFVSWFKAAKVSKEFNACFICSLSVAAFINKPPLIFLQDCNYLKLSFLKI